MFAWLKLLQKGFAVSDPDKWKKHQIDVSMLVPVIFAIVEVLRGYNVDVPVTTEQAGAIAGGIIAFVNLLFPVVRSEQLGLPNRDAPAPQARRNDDINNQPESGA